MRNADGSIAGQTTTAALRAAYCDVDGTLTATTIVTPLAWYKRRLGNPAGHALWTASLLLRGPWWILLDRISRGASNRAIYAQYAGLDAARVRALAGACYTECLRPRLLPKAEAQLNTLRRDGVRIVLVTGGLDFIMAPLAAEFGADCIAPALVEENGIFTGALDRPPLTGAEKAGVVRAHATAHGVDLTQSFAFGDAHGDLPMLECVGSPVAVNPDRRLAGVAQERHWRVERWK